MASMTDVVFLLLVFFMVTSSFVFPTALEIELPQSTEQTPLKPETRVFVDAGGTCWLSHGDTSPIAVDIDSIALAFSAISPVDSLGAVAIYADTRTEYGKIVELLNVGAQNSIKMVLATRPSQPPSQQP